MTGGAFRLGSGGRIDRARPLGFRFDGRRLEGLAGDTLASALLANGVHLVARSFKYHRPRGIFAAGAEEPNALVTVGRGARTDPNRAAPTVELYDGLEATSQGRWPCLAFDLGAITDRLAPLFAAGFYYKTFKWPEGLWPLYERAIRHAAGEGPAPDAPDPDAYVLRNAHCDVLVVGGGPAGLAAALAAGRADARVILAEAGPALGGALLDETDGGLAVDGAPVSAWVNRTVAELADLGNVRRLTRTTAFAYYDHNLVGLIESLTDHLPPGEAAGRPRQRLWKVRARRVVLATGAIERPLAFAGNDRPGVMLAAAARSYLNRHAVRPGTRAVVFTTGDLAYRTALELKAAGITVDAVVDARPRPEGALVRRGVDAGLNVLAGHVVVRTQGGRRLASVSAMALNDAGAGVTGPEREFACDLLCVSGGWNPNVALFAQSRGRLRFRAEDAVFVPSESFQAEASAGACNGTFTLAGCLAEGAAAGAAAARAAGFDAPATGAPAAAEPDQGPSRVMWRVPAPGPRRGRAFVDLRNDVTVADLELALREGYRSIEHIKRYTTTGMGTEQGKTGNVLALGVVAESLGIGVGKLGTTTFRPPYTPVVFGAVAGRNVGALFEPVRRTPMHAWHEARGARFEDVGQWQRAWYYPRPGESMSQAVARETAAARRSIGVLDYSTLGKIDIQGPDAVNLLNLVYTNAWDNLAVGRGRYGLMLRDDGMVMDDGVTFRLGEHHYLMTTTTGGAATVMAWLERWLQTEWPHLRVHLTSVSEQWACASVCGPNARTLVTKLAEGIDFSPEAFPHMAIRGGRVAGIPARVARVSFSGEMGFELSVPAGYGLPLWEALVAAGANYDITPYGTEAMHVLRAEKGFIIVGQETDGTVTPVDLGMDWIIGRRKPDFIGRRSLARAGMKAPGRKQLVGLLTEDPNVVLTEGAQLVEEMRATRPLVMVGHVTSAYMSPNVGRSIALAMVRDGRERMGRRLFAARLDGTAVPVTVSGAVFFDPAGERLRG